MITLRELLFLRPGELGRAWPFFLLYLLLFSAFSIADGVSVSLFVMQVGAGSLPLCYAVIAVANLVLIAGYVVLSERIGSAHLFLLILGAAATIFALAWVVLRWLEGAALWYGVLVVTREVGSTLILMHFGTYLQEYFSRDELNRVLPIAYAGGRVGGIAGGLILERLSAPLGTLDLIPVFLALCAASLIMVAAMSSWVQRPLLDTEDTGAAPGTDLGSQSEEWARTSIPGFLHFAWSSPVLFWTTISAALYMMVRWFLNYQYSRYFEEHFADSEALTIFLGRYTQWALVLSLALQIFAVNRLVSWLGVGGAYFAYAALLAGGALICIAPMNLTLAMFCRFLETELRFGVRNPLMQLLSNQFSRPLRIRVRAWTMGFLTPAATLASSILIALLIKAEVRDWMSWTGGALSVAHLLGAAKLHRAKNSRENHRNDGQLGS